MVGGGAILDFSSWMSKFVIAKGEDPSHSCVWVLLFINGQPIGFCSVYASNNARERCELWEWIAKELPNADWVIGGDFNMVEYSTDRSWASHAKLGHEEFDKWLHCRNSIGVIDPIHSNSCNHFQNWYTWSNCRFGIERKLSRLDRFYISPNLHLNQDPNGILVKMDYSTVLSDHFPIICSILGTEHNCNQYQLPYKLNVSHLKNPAYLTALVGICNSFPKPKDGESYRDWWHHAISQCAEFLRAFGRRMSWQRKRIEKSLQGKLEHTRKLLNSNPSNRILYRHD